MPRAPKILPPRRVTIMMIANGGLKGLANHLPAFFKGAWPAILVLSGASLVMTLGMAEAGTYQFLTTQSIVAFALLMFAGIVMMAAFGVSWRRYLLLGTPPGSFYFGRGFKSFVGRTILAILAYMIMTLIVFSLLVAISAKTQLIDFNKWAALPTIDDPLAILRLLAPLILLMAASLIPGWWWLARHMPYFTAKAVEDDSVTWRGTFPLMRGNVWPYMIGSIIAVIPVYVFQALGNALGAILYGSSDFAGSLILAIFWQVSSCAMIAISAAVGVVLYKRVIKDEAVAASVGDLV